MESLAVRWLFPGREVVVDSKCLDCGGSIRLRMRDDEILEIDPQTADFVREGNTTDASA